MQSFVFLCRNKKFISVVATDHIVLNSQRIWCELELPVSGLVLRLQKQIASYVFRITLFPCI